MTTIHSQIVERARNFYDEVRKSFFGIAKNIFDNSTTFDTCNRVFNQYSCTGNDFVHPFVSGELACGNLRNRREILSLLQALPHVGKTSDEEILFYIEKNALSGKGLGLIDVHLLASTQLSDYLFWTNDRRLHEIAKKLNLAYSPIPD